MLAIAGAMLAPLAGCGRSSPPVLLPAAVVPAQAQAVISGADDAMVIGETASLNAQAYDEQGHALAGSSWTWTSSDSSIASVSTTGVVSAVSRGRVTITADTGAQSAQQPIAVVDARIAAHFDQPVSGNRSMSGFHVGIDATQPPDAQITPLKPSNWEMGDPSLYLRTRALGAAFEYTLSDAWGYPTTGWPKGRPYDANNNYRNFVTQQALGSLGREMSWNVWNEPDSFFGTGFWDGTQQQFFETYLTAYQAIRAVLGSGAVISGPSISRFDQDYLTAFADYCLAHGCEINTLTWHELGYHRPLSTIADHIRLIRQTIVENPRYAALKISNILINESVGPQETYNPAAILTYLQYLEQGGASGSARACWIDGMSQNSCYNLTLDGLLTDGSLQPRAAWWAYKLYADGSATRVAATTTDGRYFGLASAGTASGGQALVLTGYSSYNVAAAPDTAWIAVKLQGLTQLPFRAGSPLNVVVQRVPASGEAPLAAPQDNATLSAPVKAGVATVVIENAVIDTAYSLSIR